MSSSPSLPILFLAHISLSNKSLSSSLKPFFFQAYFFNAHSPYVSNIKLPKKAFKIPPSGQLIKHNNLPVKIFLIPYDFSDMPRNSITFIRQKIYSSLASFEYLKDAIHIPIYSSSKRNIYISNSIRVVFSLRGLDADEKLRIVCDFGPDTKYLPCNTPLPSPTRLSPKTIDSHSHSRTKSLDSNDSFKFTQDSFKNSLAIDSPQCHAENNATKYSTPNDSLDPFDFSENQLVNDSASNAVDGAVSSVNDHDVEEISGSIACLSPNGSTSSISEKPLQKSDSDRDTKIFRESTMALFHHSSKNFTFQGRGKKMHGKLVCSKLRRAETYSPVEEVWREGFRYAGQQKFTAKQLERNAKKATKDEEAEKQKVKKALLQNNVEGAKIYAANAIRKHSESINFLRLASRVDAVASRVQTAVTMRAVTQSMAGVVKGMDKAMQSMNLEQISQVMDKFETQFEDLDVQTSYMESTMAQNTAQTTPADQVDELLQKVADENGLEMEMALPGANTGKLVTPVVEKEHDDLSERLARLRNL